MLLWNRLYQRGKESLDYIAGLIRECGDPPEDAKNAIDCVVQLESICREEHISTERNIAGIWIAFMSSLMTFQELYAGYLLVRKHLGILHEEVVINEDYDCRR